MDWASVAEVTPLSEESAAALRTFLTTIGRGLLETQVTELREKAPLDVVTALDLWAEDEVRKYLAGAFPDDTLLSEETSQSVHYAERIWVLDPLDGTVNRASGIPFFAVSLALLVNGTPVSAFVYAPAQDEMFEAHRGRGASLNGNPITVKQGRRFGIGVTSKLLRRLAKQKPHNLQELLLNHGRLRNLGAQAIQLCYVACGRLGAAASAETRLWDNAAGALIVEEAGGKLTNLQGTSPFPLTPESEELKGGASPCLAAPPAPHASLLQLLEGITV